MRCACGAMLAGVDLVRKGMRSAPADAAAPPAPLIAHAQDLICAFEDCGQSNPPGSVVCQYCNRPLTHGAALAIGQSPGLMTLPAALKDRYRIVELAAGKGRRS